MQQAPWQSYPLYQQRRFQPEPRPHTAHASAVPNFANSVNVAADQQESPHGSLAGLGILPEAAERRLSRDDTAADVSELISQVGVGPSRALGKCEYHFAPEERLSAWPEESQLEYLRAQPQRRSVFPPLNNSPSSSLESSAIIEQTASLGRRFSKSYKERMTDFRDNMSRYATVGKTRRASTPQGIDDGAHVPKFSGVPVPPTSPSKRNGRHEGHRQAKLNRHLLKPSDRKDTPAPVSTLHPRPSVAKLYGMDCLRVYGYGVDC